jgi:MoaA/NifB/PqqE/SkfB family radical SAM enzyme
MVSESAIDAWNPGRVEIIPTFHPSWVSINDFIAKAKLVKDKGFVRNVLYLAYPPQLQLSGFYKGKFNNENITFSVHPFFGTYNGVSYPEGYTMEEKALLVSFGAPVVDYDVNIQPDGVAAYCNNSGKQEIIGNFFDSNFILPEKITSRIFQINTINDLVSLRKEEELTSESIISVKNDDTRSEDTADKVLKPQIPRYPRTDPPYRVFWSWDMLYSCNYKCTYCNIIHGRVSCTPEQTKHKIVELGVLKDIWGRIFELYDSGVIRLTGGEPSVYPGFIQLVSFLTQKHVVNVNTNLSFDIYKFMEKIPYQNVCLNVSFHPEFITIEDLMIKLRALLKNGYGCTVCCVGYPPFLKDLERYKEILTENNIPFNMSPFLGSYEGRDFPKDYNEDEHNILRRITDDPTGKDEVNKKWLDFRMNEEKHKGKLCRMGQTYAIILPNGDIKRCCSPFTKKIGNIFEKDFEIFNDARPCDIDEKWNCPCFKAMLVGKEDNWLSLWAASQHSEYGQKKGIPISLVKG